MVLLCRALAAVVGLVVLAGLAVGGLALAIFSLGGGDGDLSVPGLARLIELPALADTVGGFLDDLEAGEGIDTVAALAGAGAVLLAIALLIGVLVPRRERLLVLSRDPDGTLAARRGALGHAVEALAEQPRDVTAAKARLRPRRARPGGRLRLRVDHAQTADGDQLVDLVRERVADLADATSLRVRVRGRVPRRGGRVR